MKSTEAVPVRKIDLTSHRDEVTSEQAAVETPIRSYLNAELVAKLFATPTAQGYSLLLCEGNENEGMLWA